MNMIAHSSLPGAFLVDLRILVLALGEAPHAGWWKSQFLSSVGLRFLERLYPRTTFAAAVDSATRAACSVHDSAIGRGSVFHLFRLPRQIERTIETSLIDQSSEYALRFQPLLNNQVALLGVLEPLAGQLPTGVPAGPVRIDGDGEQLARAMAALYLTAFRADKQVFPYFE
jgi:hypothetical protein